MKPGPTEDMSDDQLADLARLADGTLPPERRAEVEARVASSPHLTDALRKQAVALEALRGTTDTGAPARLRADIERTRAKRSRRRSWVTAPRGALAGAVAAVILALVLVLPALSGGLTVADAADFAGKPPTAPAPGGEPGIPQLLRAKVDDVPFPNYAAKFGWRPVGARHDDSEGRDATTVYYEKNGRRLAYTIVAGDPLDVPADARETKRGGVEYWTFQADGRTAVTWERGGHTCVLSTTTGGPDELVGLADWRGKGAIPF
jgi:hypothetical protein